MRKLKQSSTIAIHRLLPVASLMECTDAIGVLAVVAVLATVATVVMTTTSVLLLWKPHLFPTKLSLRRHNKSGHALQDSGTKTLEQDQRYSLHHLGSITTTATASTTQLTTIEETDEPFQTPSPPPSALEESGCVTEQNSGFERGGEGERGGEDEEVGSVPATPLSPESAETRVRKRSRVSLTSLAESISSKLGSLHPRRVSSGGHTAEEVTDLMKERSSSPSSREDELECRDSIFLDTTVAACGTDQDNSRTREDHHFVLDLHFDQGESAV